MGVGELLPVCAAVLAVLDLDVRREKGQEERERERGRGRERGVDGRKVCNLHILALLYTHMYIKEPYSLILVVFRMIPWDPHTCKSACSSRCQNRLIPVLWGARKFSSFLAAML